MQYDITADSYGYEDIAQCFKDAREATKALWDRQETEAALTMRDAEHNALGDTPGGKSLAAPLLAGTCAIFLAQECKPSTYEDDAPPACRAPAAARDSDTAADFEQVATASPTH
jgi:hypothetical protein